MFRITLQCCLKLQSENAWFPNEHIVESVCKITFEVVKFLETFMAIDVIFIFMYKDCIMGLSYKTLLGKNNG
jgi:hypothetical protein